MSEKRTGFCLAGLGFGMGAIGCVVNEPLDLLRLYYFAQKMDICFLKNREKLTDNAKFTFNIPF